MDEAYILTLDAGTTGVKCAAFSPSGEAACSAVEAYPTYYPFSGWAQQKPGEQLDEEQLYCLEKFPQHPA